MCKDIATVLLSSAALIVSIATLSVAYSQMKIASAKTKLDLYNKRFSVYVSALEYYQSVFNDSFDNKKEKSNAFIKSFRESKFLFDSNDKIYETLEKIKNNGATITGADKLNKDPEYIKNVHVDKTQINNNVLLALEDIEKNILNLEQQIEKYIKFDQITGWKFWS